MTIYFFDFEKTVQDLRRLVRTASPNERRGAWLADTAVENEYALQALEFLFDHLIQFEQFTAAAHLVTWAVPANLQGHDRVRALLNKALVRADRMETPVREALVARAGVHDIGMLFLRDARCLPPRAWFWLHSARVRGVKNALEYGTGCGSNVIHAAQIEREINWVGTDVSVEQVELNEKNARDLGVKNASFLQDDLKSAGTFESVALLDILEHTAHPVSVIDRAEKYLRPKGIMTLVVPNGPWSLATDNDVKENLAGNHINVSGIDGLLCLAKTRGRILAADVLPGPISHDANSSACVTYEVRK